MKEQYCFIDISEHNKINGWDALKKSGNIVVNRIGYRGSIKGKAAYKKIVFDAKFHEHLEGCRKHDIPYGIYFFPTAITEEEARLEGDWIVRQIKDLNLELCLPVFLDSELVSDGKGRADKLSKKARTFFLNVTLQVLKDNGIPYGVYASTSWFSDKLFDSLLIEGTQRWIAQYNSKCTYGGEYIAWQYTSKAKVPGVYKADGVTQECDRSYCYAELGESWGAVGEELGEEETAVTECDTSQRQAVIDTFVQWEGYSESNGKYKEILKIYNDYLPTAVKEHGTVNYKMQNSDSWCACAASSAYIKAGLGRFFPVECSCPRMITIAKKMGIWVEDDSFIPSPADAVLYDWGDSGSGDNKGTPDHIGLVVSVVGGKMTIIEGNKNDRVEYRTLPVNGRYIRGFVHPNITGTVKKEEVKTPSKMTKFVGRVTASSLNVRTWAGTENDTCSFSPLPRGTKVDVCDSVGASDGSEWYYIRYGGRYGFVAATYIKEV